MTAFYIVRWDFEKDNQKKKEVRPYRFDLKKQQWTSKGFPAPRPLYNLLKLIEKANCPVLIVEGEKTVHAAQQLFPDYVVVTSSDGAKAAKKTDWSTLKGREIIIAPDRGKAGKEYAETVLKLAKESNVNSVRLLLPEKLGIYIVENSSIIERKGDIPDGYDLADSLAEGWTAELINQAINDEHFAPFFVEEDLKAITANNNTTDEVLLSLAKLSDIEYGQQRKEAAKKLGVTVAILDQTVKKNRCRNQNSDDIFPPSTAWPYPVSALELLQELEIIFKRYAVLPEHTATTLALWTVFTWVIDVMDVAPILLISSPEKRCGKTTLLTVLSKLVCKPIIASNISSAALFRSIELWKPTLIIDEADTFIKNSEELRGVINSGHTRPTAYVIRTVGDNHIPTRFNTWGAKVIALIGDISDTISDRSIIIQLKRKLKNEKVEKIRNADPCIFEDIRCKSLRFAQDYAEIIKNTHPSFAVDVNISDRALDNWESLLKIAELASEDWRNKLYAAARSLSLNEVDIKPVGSELLEDIQKIFIEKDFKEISTQNLIELLCEDEESRWSTYNFRAKDSKIKAHQISKKLKEYKICSKNIRFGQQVIKGYEKKQFEDAWIRYVINIPSKDIPKLSATNLHVAATAKLSATLESHIFTGIEESCSVVADNLGRINENNNILFAMESEKISYVYSERKDLLHYLQELDKTLIYGLDIETTGLYAENSKIVLLQIYNPTLDEVFIFKVLDAPITNEEQDVLAELHLVAHNAAFEYSFMPYLKNLDCSMIAYHATSSNRRCGLADLSEDIGISYKNKKAMQTSDWSNELTEEQLEYAAKDAKATYLLWNKYKDGNKPVYDRMYKASFIINEYSKIGLPVDTEALKTLKAKKENERDMGLQSLRDMGFANIITLKGFTTKKDLLDTLSPEAIDIVDKVRKCYSYINNIIAGVENNIVNNRLAINTLICGTETGRLSTYKPNVQNFPRQGFRHIFKAGEGMVFVKADFAGQELRMAAALSGEEVMLNAFNNSIDLHALMAAKLNNISIEVFEGEGAAWKKEERQKAKAANFGFLYGMGAKRFVDTAKDKYSVEITEKEAEVFKATFWKNYLTLKLWCDAERTRCDRRKYALTLGGRRRYFEDLNKAYCEKINTAVQGSCADVLLETLLALPANIAKYLVNTVHDELVFEIPEYLVDNAFEEEIKKAMTIGAQKIAPNYPVRDIAEIKVVKTLGENEM